MQECCSALETICHPRSASLTLESALTSEEMTEIAEKMTKIHILVIDHIGSSSGVSSHSAPGNGLFKVDAATKELRTDRKRTRASLQNGQEVEEEAAVVDDAESVEENGRGENDKKRAKTNEKEVREE